MSEAVAGAQSLIDALSDAAAVIAPDLTVLCQNRAFARLTQWNPRQPSLPRGVCHALFGVSLCANDHSQCVSLQALARKRPVRYDEIDAPTIGLRFSIISVPLLNAGGQVEALIEIYRDVTAERRLQDNYRVLLDRERSRADDLERLVTVRTSELQTKNDELVALTERLSQANGALLAAERNSDRIFSSLKNALPGTILDGRIKLERQIGEGGFGAVFRAIDLSSGERRAVKIFRPQPGNASTNALMRFALESVAFAKLVHPNVVTVFESGVSSGGIAFVVLEYLEGETLKSELDRSTQIEAGRAVRIVRCVSEVIALAETQGVVHRDIKPENIFIHHPGRPDEVVKVLDFGNAKTEALPTMTKTDVMVGTPRYVAPERLTGGRCDGRADVYSAATMLFEMLSGAPPFIAGADTVAEGAELWATLMSRVNGPAPSLAERMPKLLPALIQLIDRSLERNPEARPTPIEFCSALTSLEAFLAPASS